MFLSGFVVLLLALTAEARVGFSEQQPCCETEQCFLYDVVCEADDYEVRHYESAKWAATLMKSDSIDEAAFNGLVLLSNYMDGSNEDGITMETAKPLVVRVNEPVPGEPLSYMVALLIPAEHQEHPPKPTDESVFIHTSLDSNVYMRPMSHPKAAESFASDLDSLGAKYRTEFFIFAFYHRSSGCDEVREVIFISVGDPVCVSSKELE